MKRIKFAFAAAAVIIVLCFAAPAPVKAVEEMLLQPAIVLFHDKNDNMLLNHNFQADNSIFVTTGSTKDKGFYVNIPSK